MKIKLYDQLPVAEIAQTDPTPHDSSCSRCPLGVDGRSRCVPATGSPGGLYVLGGPVTSYEALAYGPFESRQGQLVRQLIQKNWNGPVVFDHAVRCQGSEDGEGVDECRTFTAHNYALSRASRVLLIGIRAAQSLLGKRILYDLDYESAQGGYFWLTPTLPAFFMPDVTYKADNPILMREWGTLLERCLTRPIEDLVVHPTVRGIAAQLVTTVEEATAAVDALRNSGEPVTYDVETDGELGNPDFRVISLALYCRGLQDVYVWASGHIYGAEVVPALKLLADPRVTLLGQNAKFDRTAILRTFKVEVEAVNIDTMLTQRLRFADRAANLDVLSYLVGQGGYKSEIAALQDGVKKHLKKVDKVGKIARTKKFNWDAYVNKHVALVDLIRYNARDVVATADAEHMQRQWLAEPGIRQQAATRTRKQLVIPADHCAGWLEHYGAYVDRDRLNYLRQRLNAEEATVLPRLGGINANSPVQVRNRIFDSVAAGGLGLKPPTKKRTDSGLVSTDDKTISALLEQHPHIDFLRAVLDYRGVSKLRGTYVDGLEAFIRQDGRVHPNYKLDGTETGRASCENPNLYNIPRTSTEYGRLIRGAFQAMSDANAKRFGAVPLPGDPNDDVLLVQADYSQQELRVAAVLSGDKEMTAIFKSGVDYHMRTAEILAPMVWGISPEKWVQMGLDYKEAKEKFKAARAAGLPAEEVKDPRKKYRDGVKFCVAAGQLVHTHRGLKPIEAVADDDLVWDGSEWVAHEGVVYQGYKEVVEYEGIVATPDHRVCLADGEAEEIGRAKTAGLELCRTRVPWTPGGHIHVRRPRGAPGEVRDGASVVLGVWEDRPDRHLQRQDGQVEGVPVSAQEDEDRRRDEPLRGRQGGSASGQVPRDGAALPEPETPGLPELRWEGDRASVRQRRELHAMGAQGMAAPELPEGGLRPAGQQRALRAIEPSVGRPTDEPEQHSAQQDGGRVWADGSTDARVARDEDAPPGVVVRLGVVQQAASQGAECDGDSHPREGRWAHTYDIVNAGPRHRFTVLGNNSESFVILNCNFGLIYGKSDASLAEDIGCTVEEAAAIRATILGKFSSLAAWMEEQRQFARRNGGVWTWWEGKPARWRPLPDIGSPHDNRRTEAERASVNTPIQGTASDYCLSSLSVIEAMLRREKAPARPIFSVYDSIIFEARRSFIPTLVERARYVMENLWDSGDVPLVADFEVADGEARWGVMVPYETWRS